jgi:hypothetical protein
MKLGVYARRHFGDNWDAHLLFGTCNLLAVLALVLCKDDGNFLLIAVAGKGSG